MQSLPRYIWIIILESITDEDYIDDIALVKIEKNQVRLHPSPQLNVIRSLHSTCKYFDFLSQHRFMIRGKNGLTHMNYSPRYCRYTVKLNGVLDGPSFYFCELEPFKVTHYLYSMSNHVNGMLSDDYATIFSCDSLTSYFLNKDFYSGDSNGIITTYDKDIENLTKAWKSSKDVSFTFLIDNNRKFGKRLMIRFPRYLIAKNKVCR